MRLPDLKNFAERLKSAEVKRLWNEHATIPQPPPLPMEVPGLALEDTTLKAKYLEAIKDLYCPWAERHPRNRFAEYDKYRAIWCAELYNWLQGDNTLRVYSLTEFAWKVQHERLSEGGRYCMCLNWSDRRQRVYLGDGLLEYLGLLKDEVERVYPDRPTKSHYRDEIFAPEPEEPDPYESPEYAAFVEKMAERCEREDGPCDSCLAGGICDGPDLHADEPEYNEDDE